MLFWFKRLQYPVLDGRPQPRGGRRAFAVYQLLQTNLYTIEAVSEFFKVGRCNCKDLSLQNALCCGCWHHRTRQGAEFIAVARKTIKKTLILGKKWIGDRRRLLSGLDWLVRYVRFRYLTSRHKTEI